MPLLLKEDVARWASQVGASATDAEETVALAEAIAGRLCGRTLAIAEHHEHHNTARGQRHIALRQWPVVSVESIREAGTGKRPLVPADCYTIDATAGIVTRSDGLWERYVDVRYTAGYTSETCPATLRAALLRLVAWIVANAGMDPVTVDSEVPDGIVAMLAAYRSTGGGN